MLESILLIGAGGHAASCIDVIEQENRYRIAGIVGLSDEVGKKILGYPIIGSDKDLTSLIKEIPSALICLGQIKTAALRINYFQKIKDIGGHMPVIISPNAYVSPHAVLHEGSVVMHGAIINAGVCVGRNCIINSNALIEHGVNIADFCHISTASVINGDVKIGRGSFVGSGSCIRQSLTVGENCLIGLGQVVLRDCLPGSSLPDIAEVK